jgi:hypothetical protein
MDEQLKFMDSFEHRESLVLPEPWVQVENDQEF